MTDINDLAGGDPFADAPPKEAPDCTTCCDQGFVPDLTGETGVANCPDCNPSDAQVWAARAVHAGRVAAGLDIADESPF